MTRELHLPRPFGPAQEPAWFESWRAVASDAELTLRVPADASLRPSAVALLAAGLAERRRDGRRTTLAAEPGSEDAVRRLEELDFFSALGVVANSREKRTERAGGPVGLRAITTERIARELAEASVDPLHSRIEKLPSSSVRMARFVFEELGVNIVQHSGAPETGFGVLQLSPSGLELAFADRGVGFLASLQRNPELAGRLEDEGEALQLALGKGLTGTSAPRRNLGMGLGLLQDFADRLGGELWIASGSATLRRRTVAGARTTTVHSNAPWRGSWICLDAPLGAS